MIFKPTWSQSGMIMSNIQLDIPYKTIVKILGKPHLTNANSQSNMAHEYITEANWMFRFFNIPFVVEYSSISWIKTLMQRDEENRKRPERMKIPAVDVVEIGTIIGDIGFTSEIVVPILQALNGEKIKKSNHLDIFSSIFNEMKKYK